MLRYGIGALLIILIITITLSYQYNAEGFAAVTNTASKNAAGAGTGVGTGAGAGAGIGIAPIGASGDVQPIPSVAVDAAGSGQLYKADTGDASLVDRNAASQSNITTNSQGSIKIDRVVITTTSDKNYLYIYASAELIPNGNAMKYWLITENEDDPSKSVVTLSRHVFVSNDPKFKSASIPLKRYACCESTSFSFAS